uniref:Ig-like domain-containing protein n=1 Tax=Salmo trutta TaxID=8032 RepID=A0A673X7L9_SALTR
MCLSVHCVLNAGIYSKFSQRSEGVAGLPEFMGSWSVDNKTILQYDSNTMHMDADAPIPDWFLAITLTMIEQHDNLTGESSPQARLFQTHDYCQLNPDGTVHTSVSHGYNRKDFVTFVIPARTWAAAVPQAVHLVKCRANKTILKYAQQKNVDRQYRILEMQIMSVVEVVCHVTGFYPRAMQVEWLGAEGLPMVDGVSSGEVLPNGDGSYQLRKSLTVPQEAQDTQSYSCLVLHSSVAGNITLTWGKGTCLCDNFSFDC